MLKPSTYQYATTEMSFLQSYQKLAPEVFNSFSWIVAITTFPILGLPLCATVLTSEAVLSVVVQDVAKLTRSIAYWISVSTVGVGFTVGILPSIMIIILVKVFANILLLIINFLFRWTPAQFCRAMLWNERYIQTPVRYGSLIINPVIYLYVFLLPVMVFPLLLGSQFMFDTFVPTVQLKWNKRLYKPLPDGKQKIRLITISPGKQQDSLRCEFTPGDWSESTYDALSYTWEHHLVLRRTIYIDGHVFLVSDTVFQALKQLRSSTESRQIWIDALCINQSDMDERRCQVQMMFHIYEHAQRVVIWLGYPPPLVESAFQACHDIVFASNVERDQLLEDNKDCLEAIQKLTVHKWWTRVWTLQEVVAAKNAILLVGPHWCSWDDFSAFVLLAHDVEKSPHLISKEIQECVKTIMRLKADTDDPQRSLLNIAYTFRNRNATDGRDKLYGLMGLLTERERVNSKVQPDYTIQSNRLFSGFTIDCIESSKSLAVLAVAEQLRSQNSSLLISSWAMNWSNETNTQYSVPLWGGEYLETPLFQDYNADGGMPAEYQHDEQFPESIFLRGLSFEEILAVGPRVREPGELYAYEENNNLALAIDYWEAMYKCLWEDPEESPAAKLFNSTILCDEDAEMLVNWRQWLQDLSADDLVNAQASIFLSTAKPNWLDNYNFDRIQTYEDEILRLPDPSVDRAAYNEARVKYCCRRRRFFMTKNGVPGLGPSIIEKGDVVALLFGSRVPVILRPKKQWSWSGSWDKLRNRKLQSSQEEEVYSYVGQAFVNGIMKWKGSMEEDINSRKVIPRWFHLE
jgi:hypothetical protein